jgi:predicted dehydrogenase
MPDSIKVAVITNAEGAHLSAYFSALRDCPEASSVVLCDPSGLSFESAGKTLGKKLTKTYKNRDEMLRAEKPGMALVSLEAAIAPPEIDAALEAGCHVFAEKPSCVRAEDFAKLTRKADAKHLHLMLALANRSNPEIIEAKKIIRTGKLGRIYGLEMHIIADQTRLTSPSYHKQWFAKKSRGGGGHLTWIGIHWLDLAMYVTGSRIEQVAGFTGNVGGQPIDVEDSAAVALKFDDGFFGTLTSGYYLQRGYNSHVKIWGSHGWLHLEPMEDVPLTWSSSKEKSAEPIQYTGPKTPRAYSPFIRSAVRASAGLEDAPIDSADSLHVIRTVFACYDAAETGRTQKVE